MGYTKYRDINRLKKVTLQNGGTVTESRPPKVKLPKKPRKVWPKVGRTRVITDRQSNFT
jgi:hypothetical protein